MKTYACPLNKKIKYQDPGTGNYPAYPNTGYRFGQKPNWFWVLESLEMPMRIKIYTTGIENRDPSWTKRELIEVEDRWPEELVRIGYGNDEYFADARWLVEQPVGIL